MAYFISARLSENIGRTGDGYLICRDAVLARSGTQVYKARELPQDEVEQLGLSFEPEENVELHRDPDEVFSEKTLSSGEGKPVTLKHPKKFLAVESGPYTEAACDQQRGHIRNLRRGSELLTDGNIPMIGDVIVTEAEAINAVEQRHARELSLGYGFHLAMDGSRLLQVDMEINHCAIVERGRCGGACRIVDGAFDAAISDTCQCGCGCDAKSEEPMNDASPEAPRVHDGIAIEEPKPKEIVSADVAASGETEKPRKEKHKVTNVFKHLLGLGLKAYAADADPEQISEAAEAVKTATQPPTTKAARANDEEPEKKAEEKKSEEKKEEKQATDESAADPRTRMHNTLDRMLDKRAKDTKKAEDVDMDEFKNLMTEYLSEEGEEPEHEEAAANDGETADESEKEAEGEEEGEEKKAEGRDSEFIEPIPLEEKRTARRSGQSFDALKAFKELRPFIARSKDAKLKKAFNVISARANDAAARELGSGSYKEFQQAARTERTEGAQGRDHLTEEQQENAKLTAEYAKRLGKPISKEVM